MKKIYLILFMLGLSASTLFASVATFTDIKGEVTVLRKNSPIEAIKNGSLEEKDIVQTSKEGAAKIAFQDNTTITLGKETIFKIEEYLFEDGKSKTNLKITEGVFRAVTGEIGKINPDKFKLHTRNATIGIRGTEILGFVSEEQDIIECLKGIIEVCNEKGCEEVKEGKFTIVKKGFAPKRSMDKDKKDKKTKKPNPQSGSSEDTTSETSSSQDDGDTTTTPQEENSIINVSSELSNETLLENQPPIGENGLTQTPESVIQGYIDAIDPTVTAQYLGSVGNATKDGSSVTGGAVDFMFSFGDQTYEGTFVIDDNNFNVINAPITTSGFSAAAANINDGVYNMASGGITNGKFYGSGAETIGGNINVTTDMITGSVHNYTGTISATKVP
ncbi:MAG: FecR domain-containing protein [Sulfurospirillaceae bacterium]|nr:FecR domain-containing protein [Sulfurospirillaceae bacterium]